MQVRRFGALLENVFSLVSGYDESLLRLYCKPQIFIAKEDDE
jgi:hypothetical protein